MSKDYRLELFQNAIDSLDESVEYYKISIEDESKYKFCIILLFHFMELILKHLVELQNPLLCYQKPFSKNIIKEKTITWGQAVQVLLNCNIIIDDGTRKHLKNLANLRNDIIHYKFQYNTSEIRNLLINIFSDMREIYEKVTDKDFYIDTEDTTKILLDEIEGGYLKDLHLAQAEAKEVADGHEVYACNICGEDQTVNINAGEYYCHFCGDTDSDKECVRCGQELRETELIKFGETNDGDSIFICENCNDDIEKE
ncbi:MAG: hypothetical protein C0399_10345 [Syntrophus sp. (in: bacteria)]|nr:hypothetical protein [Syntrophus sp. (in: bacteria)]